MLNVTEETDDGTAVPTLDLRLAGEALILLVEQYGLFGARAPLHLAQPYAAEPKENLDKLIRSGAFKPLDLLTLTRGSPSIRYNTQEKRALAVCLGYCLMDFFDADLSSQRIYFLGSTKESRSGTLKQTLYLSFASNLPATAESHIFRIGHPTLLSFAKLLLEIEFGQSIDFCITSNCDKTNRATWAELCDMVDQLEEERNDSYLQAVRGCLMAHRQISRALRLGAAYERDAELTIRKELYGEVVEKLEAALAESTPRTGNKRQRSESPDPIPRTKLRLSKPNFQGQSEQEASFHSAIAPKTWLRDLMTISRQVEIKRREWRVTAPIRVAILDTGLDWDFPVFRKRTGLLKSISDVKDFVTSSTPTATDIFGHGTFMARLIMECAPGAEILVARVAENTDKLKNSQANVKEAILWAGQAGRADIISMSFGFPRDDPGIREAIETVQKQRNEEVIFIASAGNSSTDDESFPARHPSVISVYATNSHGTFLQSNPVSTSNGADILGAYGDDIPDAIREEFRTTYPKVCQPGSSVATAVMAGISATMLAYADVLPSLVPFQREAAAVLQCLRTTKGMEALLFRLAPNDRDHPRLRAVNPMWFWKNRSDDTMRYNAISEALWDIHRRLPRRG
ncbi:eb9e5973-4242-4e07-a02c-a10ffa8441c9 [Thermothielavioides terrestris]|uniref:Eb9e5973-4242-4e07-a02c-a10ffa8441c9 n=1 Tax=Thermothielavioides terrestris TaxID=2587410 RepID=A0A446BXA7_9PEZI|nr:eb9e5973-4242-4e07-a02c-a10ffa8441c9 [Thermothielavioides terrestris]